MVITHNLLAMNANRNLSINDSSQKKSTEKLSSGYRINRASDDAAGLAISEKMRSQIRGLDKASINASDGISVVQTAEGALNEVHSILQRMNELATQAANDTNTSIDRSQLQLEIDQLTSEIDRISSSTQFNTMNLLDGSFVEKNLQVGALSGQKIEVSIAPMSAEGLGLRAATSSKLSQNTNTATATVSNSALNVDINDPNSVRNTTLFFASYNPVTHTNASLENGLGNAASFTVAITSSGQDYFTATGSNSRKYAFYLEAGTRYDTTHTVSHTGWYTMAYSNGNQVNSKSQIGTANIASITDVSSYINLSSGTPANKDYIQIREGYDTTSSSTVNGWVERTGNSPSGAITNRYGTDLSSFGINVTGSPSAGDSIILTTSSGNTGLVAGASHIIVDSYEHAGNAMQVVQNAIDMVSTQRAKLGAIQNRLEHTIANLDVTSENTSAAESRIRDTDMAKEMVQFSVSNILAQAGQAMLSQANQSTQSVLSLLS